MGEAGRWEMLGKRQNPWKSFLKPKQKECVGLCPLFPLLRAFPSLPSFSNEYFLLTHSPGDRLSFLSCNWCQLSSAPSPDESSESEAGNRTVKGGKRAFLLHSLGQGLEAPKKLLRTRFIPWLPKAFACSCPPVVKIKDVSYWLRKLPSFKTPAMFWQTLLLSPQIEQMSLHSTV